jgi:hypothetical protein
MVIKRAPHLASTLTLEEHRRLVQVVTLLVTVSRRTAAAKRKTRKTDQDKKENGVRRIRGPCFFANNPYHGLIDCPLARNDYHDRQHSTSTRQRYVPH